MSARLRILGTIFPSLGDVRRDDAVAVLARVAIPPEPLGYSSPEPGGTTHHNSTTQQEAVTPSVCRVCKLSDAFVKDDNGMTLKSC